MTAPYPVSSARARIVVCFIGALAATVISDRVAEPSDPQKAVERLTTREQATSTAPDPDLEPGFPVQALETFGSWHGGPGLHTLVGNIDADPELEIVVTSIGGGPLNAWNHDGSVIPGWPVSGLGASYPAMGNLSTAYAGSEVFSARGDPGGLSAWSGSGVMLPGWPRDSSNYIETPPTLADIDGDGLDEIFIGEEDQLLHGYRADGSILPGWPGIYAPGGQDRHTPAVADLDGDGALEIITVSGSGNSSLTAYHGDGSIAAGFPVILPVYTDTFPVVGDVDGDGDLEICVVMSGDAAFRFRIAILSANGSLERTITATTSLFYGTAPALGDLDGDAVPEIIAQGEAILYAWKGDGSPVSGWPQSWVSTSQWLGDSAPVVGDLTGDCLPDIAVTSQYPGSPTTGELRVYDRAGNLHPRFPKVLPIGWGAVPAIADMDLDGRNELVVSAMHRDVVTGTYDKVWMYDLGGPPHGSVLWGQFMSNGQHHARYRAGELTSCAGVVQAALTVDATPGPDSDGNNVLDPGETVVVAPAWRNVVSGGRTFSSAISAFTGPRSFRGTYSVIDGRADYGTLGPGMTTDCETATQDCLAVSITQSGRRPVSHWDARFEEGLSTGGVVEWTVHVGGSFRDVSRSSGFYRFIETLLHDAVTTGCSTGRYCPEAVTSRAQMAVFVLLSKEGGGYVPPACTTPIFTDVPASDPFCPWVEELARRGVVAGCGGGKYCPSDPVSRQQMAVFVLATKDPGVTPQPCGTPSVFDDVPAASPYCRWIEELARRGVVAGCGGGSYCPAAAVNREQMSVFLVQTFALQLYGP